VTEDPRTTRWARLYALVAGLLALETFVFWLLSKWAA
jgi:hypothetical protein